MGLTLITPPTREPITLEEAKAQCRIDVLDEVLLLYDYIRAARDQLETEMRRQFLTATWRLSLATFPACGWLKLPRPPLQSITSIAYLDTAGVSQVLAPTVYGVDTTCEPGRVYLRQGQSWPSILDDPLAVQITYVAGSPTLFDVPAEIRQAMRLLVAHWFENREATVEKGLHDIPLGVERLLWNKRIVEMY